MTFNLLKLYQYVEGHEETLISRNRIHCRVLDVIQKPIQASMTGMVRSPFKLAGIGIGRVIHLSRSTWQVSPQYDVWVLIISGRHGILAQQATSDRLALTLHGVQQQPHLKEAAPRRITKP